MSTGSHLTAAPRADARLAVPALIGWLAAVVLVGVPDTAVPVCLAALAATTVALGLSRRERSAVSRRRTRVAGMLEVSIPSIIVLAVIAGAVALAAPARTPPALVAELERGDILEVQLELEQTVQPPRAATADALIVAVIPSATGAHSDFAAGVAVRVPVRVPVRLVGLDVEERLPLGTRLQGRVRFVPLEPGDDRVGVVRAVTTLHVIGAPNSLVAGADDLRASFLTMMAPFPGDGGALLPGLAIGDTTAVGDDLDAAMKHSSLSHLTAVSGANCAIVVGLVLAVGALARWPRPVRVIVALVALGGFVVLVTPEPSVVRAAVMAAIVLITVASGRPARGLPVLALAVLAIIVSDPWIAREYGFVLSVLATAALLVLAGPLTAALSRWLPAPLALALAVPLAAQLACQPVLIMLAPEIPLIGVLANMLAAPAAPVATIVGMVACLLAPIIPPLAVFVAGIAWLPAAWIAGVARVCAQLPGALLPWPEGALGATLLGVVIAAALFAAGVPARLGTARLRAAVAFGAACAIVVVAGATAGVSVIRTLGHPADWVIAQCDVGQGDAVVLRSAGQVALIDTGPDPEPLARCLETLGISRLDLLVLTHFDLDHAGGVQAVAGRVEHALVGPSGRAADDAIVDVLLAGGAQVAQGADGDRGVLGHYRWRALGPPPHRGVEPGNDASLILEFRPGAGCPACPSLLALGDLGADAQRRLAAAHPVRAVDVVKVSHHGSPDQHAPLYEALDASIALIGVGEDNGYGHPADSLLQTLAATRASVVRSDLNGLALVAPAVESAQPGLRLWVERGGLGGAGQVGGAE